MKKINSVWDVDRLLASQLLTELGSEADPQILDKVARMVAQHRANLAGWGAERAQQAMLERLGERIQSEFREHSAHWYDGFREAEACVAVMTTGELLEIDTQERSRGEYLRALVKQARGKGAQPIA